MNDAELEYEQSHKCNAIDQLEDEAKIKEWSPYQIAIFNAIRDYDANYIIEAVAGSGKTTTLEQGLKYCKAGKSVLVLAFNKSIADELRNRIGDRANVRTFHSFGYMISRAGFGKVKIVPSKVYRLLKTRMTSEDLENYSYSIKRMISLMKNAGNFSPTEEDWIATMNDFEINIDEDFMPTALRLASAVFSESISDTETLDFDDQLFLPLLYDLTFPTFDYIFVDEAQDLSPVQHLMLEQLLSGTGHIYAVGDTHQAIYGFRGADHNSMNRFRNVFSCKDLPLSITYRCPISITREAQKFVPHIQYREDAPMGKVIHTEVFEDWLDLGKDDIVMCRNNAPLFNLGMKFIRAQKPVTIAGNFNGVLKKFIKDFKTKDIEVFKMRVTDYLQKQGDLLLRKDKHSKYAILLDKCQSVLICAEASKSVPELLNLLETLFQPGVGVKLCSIHKAKGLEATRVIIYKPSLIPSKWARSDNAMKQEMNLKYVAITRAKETLIYAED